MDIMNIFTGISVACVGSLYIYYLFPNNYIYYTSFGIIMYYVIQTIEEMEKVSAKKLIK
jgi:hypothetical protein